MPKNRISAAILAVVILLIGFIYIVSTKQTSTEQVVEEPQSRFVQIEDAGIVKMGEHGRYHARIIEDTLTKQRYILFENRWDIRANLMVPLGQEIFVEEPSG